MSTFQVVVSRVIDARPEAVYSVITDMEEPRRILPKEFTDLVVEKGAKVPAPLSVPTCRCWE